MKSLSIILFVLMLSACQLVTKQEQPGDNVTLASKEPAGCENVGIFFGRGSNPDKALISFLNAVAKHGGSHAYITDRQILEQSDPIANTIPFLSQDHITHGRGFKCPA